MEQFREGHINILVADLAARGIDVRKYHMWSLPFTDVYEAYVHRSGRTARAGAKGHNRIASRRSRKSLILKGTGIKVH
jgi:ATP-dependent RNA helicase DeaD